ncbi:hypothetical protein T484DRAFT_1643919, partial [Baffinella frigidus]
TLHPTPYTLHPTPCTLHPAPYTLHPTPCTLHRAPYSLHPTPYTLTHTHTHPESRKWSCTRSWTRSLPRTRASIWPPSPCSLGCVFRPQREREGERERESVCV